MNYKKEEIKKGVCLHTIETNKFKTNLFTVMLATTITKENVTKNALISLILRRGTNKLQSQEEISKELENMYGAEFDCGIDKMGDNHILKFYLESLNDEYLPKYNESLSNVVGADVPVRPQNNFQNSINLLLDIVFNPLTENNKFKQEYFDGEKEKLKQIIEGKKDNKGLYAFNRCIEEMYKEKPYGLYKYGNIEDLEKITNEELYSYYKELIQKCKIDIFISGDILNNKKQSMSNVVGVDDQLTHTVAVKGEAFNSTSNIDPRIIIQQNQNIQKLYDRNPQYIENSTGASNARPQENIIEEKMDITQGKLVIGMNVGMNNFGNENVQNIALIYNAILGGTANSKLFQNVREKASLAYTAASNYVRQKNNIFIRAGIEIENYEKALKIIREQIENMKKGDFTEEEVENTKQYIISTIQGIPDEQDTEITYYFGQELAGTNNSIEEYIQNINSVTREQIIELAQTISINTIYFLRN